MNIFTISAIRDFCSGCGVCVSVCPQTAIKILKSSILNTPCLDDNKCIDCGICVDICPGYKKYVQIDSNSNIDKEQKNEGVAECNLCYSSDEKLRYESSSGGYITALLKELLECQEIDGVVSLRKSKDSPLEYESSILQDINSILESKGSKYFPVSTCENVKDLKNIDGIFVFVGKPCEVQAIRNLTEKYELYKKKFPLMISIFCHHTPPRNATKDLLKSLGIQLEKINSLNYRGNGWPGYFRITDENGTTSVNIPYREVWDNHLSKSMPLVCKMCQDPFGKFADISVGDAWGFPDQSQLGKSAVILRTTKGKFYHSLITTNTNRICCFNTTLNKIYAGQSPLISKQKSAYIYCQAYKLSTYKILGKISYLHYSDHKFHPMFLIKLIRYYLNIIKNKESKNSALSDERI